MTDAQDAPAVRPAIPRARLTTGNDPRAREPERADRRVTVLPGVSFGLSFGLGPATAGASLRAAS
jgi:hypothetical protein